MKAPALLIRILIVLVFSSLYIGCLFNDEEVLTESTGKSGDLVIVLDSSGWSGEAGNQARSCFSAPQEGLPQSEPIFNVIKVLNSEFRQLFKTTRNIIYIERIAEGDKSEYAFKENLWSKNQAVLFIRAKNNEEVSSILEKNCDLIKDYFQQQEWKRLQRAYASLGDESISEVVAKHTGMKPVVPSDYVIALEKENFIWLRKDFQHQGHQINMGLVFYKLPYDSVGMLESGNILGQRDYLTKVIEGPIEGSHMATYQEYVPAEREIGFDNKYVKELRGLWNMKGAFMGGPFVHYAFVDKSGKFLLNIDAYVFAPKFDKREYLRELEAISLSAVK